MVDEPIILRGISYRGAGAAPTLVQRRDQEFVPAILAELSSKDALSQIAASVISPTLSADLVSRRKTRVTPKRVSDPNGFTPSLQLYQPVHRIFNVAVLEAICDQPGSPRIDPARIESAGLVVRRLVERNQLLKRRGKGNKSALPSEAREGWMQSGQRLRGWVEFPQSAEDRQEKLDPEPARRAAQLRSGNAEIDRLLAEWQRKTELFTETVSPLFVAPPEVCAATGRTILYGVVTVSSSEMSEGPDPLDDRASADSPPFDLDDLDSRLAGHLPFYLQAEGKGWSPVVPRAGGTLTFANSNDNDLKAFVLSLRQLKFEFGAFDDSNEGSAIFAELNKIRFAQTSQGLGTFLKAATSVLVDGDGSVAAIRMPAQWPKMDARASDRIQTVVRASLSKRLQTLAGSEGRFDDTRRRYRVRAFIRVKGHDQCPPRLVWSDYSEPFRIAPWYEGSGAPPVQVTLPDATDKNFLRSLKPNVAFVLPESLMNLLNKNKPKDFIDEKAQDGGGGIGLDWICSFNIPIITICAFIVLNIFLVLFNIIFQWLFFIKICIPFPRKK
ncbi:MAG TPA: hypothetical protein VFV34_02680 [Blastocatellia bacterium]|nr:hypothetical protein [Blastocatellia bacterium]